MPASASIEAVPAAPTVRPGRARVWFQAVRFFSFTASAIPILVGSSLAVVDRSFDPVLFLAMLIASVACHAGANLANDYFDHRKGIDTDESLGPSKVIQLGYLTPRQVVRGLLFAFSVATTLGLYIVYRSGWPILVLAVLSLIAAVLYTGGPKPLGYVALGELTVFVFMGPVMVTGAYYVHTGVVSRSSVLVSVPIGLLAAAILHANNIRDIDLDREAGKQTLANLLGRHAANIEYAILVLGSYIAIVMVVLLDPRLWPLTIALVTIPTAASLARTVFSKTGPLVLNGVLRRTAGLHLRVGGLMTIALLFRASVDQLF
ncbi:1,4-dihydroxy-2-naphthoate polyprenyltransferase [soil metagenome]